MVSSFMSEARLGRLNDGLNQDCPPEHVHVAFPAPRWTSQLVAQVSKSKCSQRTGRSMALYDLALEVTWGHFCCIFLVKVVTIFLTHQIQRKGTFLSLGEVSIYLQPCFQTLKVSLQFPTVWCTNIFNLNFYVRLQNINHKWLQLYFQIISF